MSRLVGLVSLVLPLVFVSADPPAKDKERANSLPSWKDGATKKGILDFVRRVTDKNSKDYVAPEDRIATFDNDGTLWCEQPLAEVTYTKERIKAMAAKDVALRGKQLVKMLLAGDYSFLKTAGEKALLELFAISHAGMTQEQFEADAGAFLAKAKHPRFDVLYPKLAYQPMIELLEYLRANGFQTWICSGGTVDFIRLFSQEVYGVPPQQVIGSRFEMEWREQDGRMVLWRKGAIATINDKGGKPVNIAAQIGKRPVFAAGNVRSGGDIAMLTYCQGRKGASFQLVIDHDDEKREFAYAEKDGATLAAAKKNGWAVASMKSDWGTVFANVPAKKEVKP